MAKDWNKEHDRQGLKYHIDNSFGHQVAMSSAHFKAVFSPESEVNKVADADGSLVVLGCLLYEVDGVLTPSMMASQVQQKRHSAGMC